MAGNLHSSSEDGGMAGQQREPQKSKLYWYRTIGLVSLMLVIFVPLGILLHGKRKRFSGIVY